MSGQKFTVKGGDVPSFEKAVQSGMLEKGKISNLIGRLGQHTSSLAGAAITNSLVSELAKSLNISSSSMQVTATYEDTGDIREGQYRYQTDNKLSIKVSIGGENGGELDFSFNISDKANKELERVELVEEVNKLEWISIEGENFFDMKKYAGEGNIGHIIEEIKKVTKEDIINLKKEHPVFLV